MKSKQNFFQLTRPRRQELAKPLPGKVTLSKKTAGVMTVLVLASNLLTYAFLGPGLLITPKEKMETAGSLYLMDKASLYVLDTEEFEKKVKKISKKLSIPPEWLMAVMYSESRFDASVANRKGSGATGLIQFMPATAKELNTSVEHLRNISPTHQLDFVYRYQANVRSSYGDFGSLTDLYLAILYPKALEEDYCFTLYSKPSIHYANNRGLDEDKDGRVTVSDIDKRMMRIYPTAFTASLED
jgi:hypothetical protein